MKNPRVRRPERVHKRVRRLRFPKLERRNHLFLQESSDDIRILLFTTWGQEKILYWRKYKLRNRYRILPLQFTRGLGRLQPRTQSSAISGRQVARIGSDESGIVHRLKRTCFQKATFWESVVQLDKIFNWVTHPRWNMWGGISC